MAKREPKAWITVNGVHVPIYEGESKADAVKRRKEQLKKSIDKDNDAKEKQIAKNKAEKDKLNDTGKKENKKLKGEIDDYYNNLRHDFKMAADDEEREEIEDYARGQIKDFEKQGGDVTKLKKLYNEYAKNKFSDSSGKAVDEVRGNKSDSLSKAAGRETEGTGMKQANKQYEEDTKRVEQEAKINAFNKKMIANKIDNAKGNTFQVLMEEHAGTAKDVIGSAAARGYVVKEQDGNSIVFTKKSSGANSVSKYGSGKAVDAVKEVEAEKIIEGKDGKKIRLFTPKISDEEKEKGKALVKSKQEDYKKTANYQDQKLAKYQQDAKIQQAEDKKLAADILSKYGSGKAVDEVRGIKKDSEQFKFNVGRKRDGTIEYEELDRRLNKIVGTDKLSKGEYGGDLIEPNKPLRTYRDYENRVKEIDNKMNKIEKEREKIHKKQLAGDYKARLSGVYQLQEVYHNERAGLLSTLRFVPKSFAAKYPNLSVHELEEKYREFLQKNRK